jgi:hypothetical protein
MLPAASSGQNPTRHGCFPQLSFFLLGQESGTSQEITPTAARTFLTEISLRVLTNRPIFSGLVLLSGADDLSGPLTAERPSVESHDDNPTRSAYFLQISLFLLDWGR